MVVNNKESQTKEQACSEDGMGQGRGQGMAVGGLAFPFETFKGKPGLTRSFVS